MEIIDLKKLFIDLIVVPTKEFSQKRDKWEVIFNSNFSIKNAFRSIEITEEDVLNLWENPSIDSPAVLHFFDQALPYYKPENCLTLKPKVTKVYGTIEALSEDDLFELFKKLYNPYTHIDWEREGQMLIDKFNSNFVSADFYGDLMEEFYWDETVEDPDEYDDEIRKRIREELNKR